MTTPSDGPEPPGTAPRQSYGLRAPTPVPEAPAPEGRNGWAIAALVFGLFGGLLGIFFGILGLRKANEGYGGRRMALAGLTLSALWIVIIGVTVGFRNSDGDGEGTLVEDGDQVGDCFEVTSASGLVAAPAAGAVSTLEVGCDQPHHSETYAVFPLPEGDFPGEKVVSATAKRCMPALQKYSARAAADDSFEVSTFLPNRNSWDRFGNRAVICSAFTESLRSGSIRD